MVLEHAQTPTRFKNGKDDDCSLRQNLSPTLKLNVFLDYSISVEIKKSWRLHPVHD